MTRLIDADALPRHGKRGGLVRWQDIEKAPTVDAIPVEDVEKMIETVKSLPNVSYFLKYYAATVMDALISGWRAEEKKNEK